MRRGQTRAAQAEPRTKKPPASVAGRAGKSGEPRQTPARVEDGELFPFRTDALGPPGAIPPLKITKKRAKPD
ncbi:MAG: hypothetical protein ACK5XO_02570, partial [Phycisphaerales bacterium]